MFRKITILAVLIALVVAVLPTSGVFAATGTNEDLEKKWDQLITNFNRQEMNHVKAHKWVDRWLIKNKNDKDRPEVERHLAICNTALMDAHAIVAAHAGFSANGKVIKRTLAAQSIRSLANALRMHAASVKKLAVHVK